MRKHHLQHWTGTAWLVLGLQIASLVLPAVGPRTAAAQTNGSEVDRGRTYYEQSRFDEAISLLKDLVDRGALAGDDLRRARELLARSYVKKGYPVRARDMFKDILRDNPAWRPDPIRVPPDETAVFEQALREFEAEQAAEPAAPDTTQAQPVTPPPQQVTPPPPPPTQPVDASTVVPVQEKKKSNLLWWVLGGIGAAALVAVAAAGGGGGDGGSDTPPAAALPAYPPPPSP